MQQNLNLIIVKLLQVKLKLLLKNQIHLFCSVYLFFLSKYLSNLLFQDYGGTLEWSGKIQSYILASFYWAYIVSQIVGGLATQKLGTKRVFGYAQLATALCSLSIPWASETHFGLVIGLRFVQGFASVSHILVLISHKIKY